MSRSECIGCQYLGRNVRNKKTLYYCTHPNQKYISDYWRSHNIIRDVGLVYYGANFEKKTTPKWCPKGKKNDD